MLLLAKLTIWCPSGIHCLTEACEGLQRLGGFSLPNIAVENGLSFYFFPMRTSTWFYCEGDMLKYDTVHVLRSEEDLWEPVLSFHEVSFWDPTQTVRNSSRYLYVPRCLAWPQIISECLVSNREGGTEVCILHIKADLPSGLSQHPSVPTCHRA